MLNGLDLFSGIGGITLALQEWVRPIAYCEKERYAQAVLLSRMRDGQLPIAPIWDDVCTLRSDLLGNWVDIIYGGFPCQDISTAGAGAGLAGERSGLFFEIIRLTRDLRPSFVFLENVPAISVRGLDRVLLEFTALGYDCRWTIVSAAEVGAPHLRERWFLLAHTNGNGLWQQQSRDQRGEIQEQRQPGINGAEKSMADTYGFWKSPGPKKRNQSRNRALDGGEEMANAESIRSLEGGLPGGSESQQSLSDDNREYFRGDQSWATEPDVGRVAHGIPARLDRISSLGNAVVPLAVKKAFCKLMFG